MAFLNAKTDFIFDPLASDNTYNDIERAKAEGWFALEAVTIDEASRQSCAAAIQRSLDYIGTADESSINYDNEEPFINPRDALRAMRMALRALVAADKAMPDYGHYAKVARREMQTALLEVGNTLIGVEAVARK